ncbi:hypothetical protein BU25DRAFT_427670 [Macroventuria anomochaeta]|uniref:Uncharacterized protein n=1 Tax=Macroventuria anomochaeta TaxID=301207 RepID=A0ACB6SFT4_9PLEO|nr:uncharacterized protein BU25DRAFT_427670 [Macroventuria anomochaeta]KAF2632833.1 hypothetical protein BU25DRAFT_427670 [Macroventuria anomochaeta]
MAPAWRIAQPYCVALAPQINSPEPLWYVECKVMSGEDKLFYSQTYFETNYTDLSRWTKTLPNASRTCFVTFGLNLSYFACAPGHGSIWAGIPSELEDKVRKSFDTPSCVSLGAHNAWFVLWPDGNCSWKFNGHYHALDKILTEAAPRSVSYVAISPYNKHHYFVAFRDQSLKYDFTGAPTEWMKLMKEVFDAWAAERLQKPQQQFIPPNALPYPHRQLHQPPQPQQQAAYYYNNFVAELPPAPAHAPLMSPPLTPNTPSTGYPSPVLSNAAPNNPYGYRPSLQGAVEMPVELPGNTTLVAPAPAPTRSTSTEVCNHRH